MSWKCWWWYSVLMREAVHDRNDSVMLSATSAFSLKGSLWENNKGCFLATQTSIMRAVIRPVTTSLPCCAILGGVGSGKTGYPPLFSLVLTILSVCMQNKVILFIISFVCVGFSVIGDNDRLCHTVTFLIAYISPVLSAGQRIMVIKHMVTAGALSALSHNIPRK